LSSFFSAALGAFSVLAALAGASDSFFFRISGANLAKVLYQLTNF